MPRLIFAAPAFACNDEAGEKAAAETKRAESHVSLMQQVRQLGDIHRVSLMQQVRQLGDIHRNWRAF